MNLKNFLLAKRAMRRWTKSYKQRTFIGFAPKGKFGFKSYYFAHVYTAHDYLLGIKVPRGACVTALQLGLQTS